MTELEKDMQELVKKVWELSEKHGGIYITAVHSQGHGMSSVDYGGPIKSLTYWSEKNTYTNY